MSPNIVVLPSYHAVSSSPAEQSKQQESFTFTVNYDHLHLNVQYFFEHTFTQLIKNLCLLEKQLQS